MSIPSRSVPFLALGGIFDHADVQAAQQINLSAAEPNGNFFPLPEEPEFQKAFAAHEGAQHAIAVNSCGTALDACMMALGIKEGDEVITTPLTFVCSATCAIAQGAKVVFADIDPHTLCLDPEKVRAKITDKTKAIIPVHFAGLACDIDGFDAITRDTDIPVIYDAAHAVGTTFKGQPVGGAGKASCYSFQSNKNITTLGEGGAITTNDANFAEVVRQKKTFGYVYGGPKIRVASIGFNYRMTKPQLAVGITQIAKAPRIIREKLSRFKILHDQLSDIDGLALPAGIEDGHGAHLYIVRITQADRDEVVATLRDKYQIGTAYHYPIVWTWEVFNELEYDCNNCNISEKASSQVISLPVFAQSSDDDLQYIAYALRKILTSI